MPGWIVEVHRQREGVATPAKLEPERGERIAIWQTGFNGADWLFELARSGKGVDLGGIGYPCWFTAPAREILPRIMEKPPGARDHWIANETDVVIGPWAGKTILDQAVAEKCTPDDWLIIEAWDES